MNRRNFFKVVTGFVAGAVATVMPKAKSKEKLICGGQNGTLCPRCKFNVKAHPTKGDWIDVRDFGATIGERLGCKDCSNDCIYFDDCLIELKLRERIWSHPAFIIHEDGSIEPIPYQDFYKTKFT